MKHEVTPAVERALEFARRLAATQGDAEATAWHLLQGLIRESGGQVGSAAAAGGLDRDRLACLQVEAKGSSDLEEADLPHANSEIQRVLRRASVLRREWSASDPVGSDLLLYALLDEIEEIREKLIEQGLDLERFSQYIENTWRGPLLQLDEPLELIDPVESVDVARVIDANANRAREALRVIEDHCRFVADDPMLTRQVKELRHEVSAAVAELPGLQCVRSRDITGDVGTAISTHQERQRESTTAVVVANLKRLQESLRSIEEYSKLVGAQYAGAFEKFRYRAYALEKALFSPQSGSGRLQRARLYLLLGPRDCHYSLEPTIRGAVAGGVDVIQLREKRLPDRQLLEIARAIRRWTRESGTLFIVNDRPDLARLSEADGVHLGQDDLPARQARRLLGPEAIIGVSTHSPEQLAAAVADGADYIGVGPVFHSATKHFDDFAGLTFVQYAAEHARLPWFAIGGINVSNVAQVVAAGARRIAVSSAICKSDAPEAVARALRQVLDAAPMTSDRR